MAAGTAPTPDPGVLTEEPVSEVHWTTSFFTDTYTDADTELRNPHKTQAMVECAVSALNLTPGARVLDLACGTGRHSVLLAERGLTVTGVDLSARYLERARARPGARPVSFVQADMRELAGVPGAPFDAVLSLHTSFGFFDTDEENLHVLRQVRQMLAPGGKLFLDVMNRDWFLSQGSEPFGTVPGEFVCRNFDSAAGRTYLHEERFDPLTSRIRWHIRAADGPADGGVTADYRVYSAHELLDLLSRAGLAVQSLYGGYDRSAFHTLASHLIATAVRQEP